MFDWVLNTPLNYHFFWLDKSLQTLVVKMMVVFSWNQQCVLDMFDKSYADLFRISNL